MKHLYTAFLMVALLGSAASQGQTADYQPLVREGVVWHYAYIEQMNPDLTESEYRYIDNKIEFSGDTAIGGVSYKKCYVYSTDEQDVSAAWLASVIREEAGNIITNNGYGLLSGHGYLPFSYPWGSGTTSKESVLYNLNDFSGHMFALYAYNSWPSFNPELVKVDSVSLGDARVARYTVKVPEQGNGSFVFVEGVGPDGGERPAFDEGYFFQPFPPAHTGISSHVGGLIKLTDLQGNLLYKGSLYGQYSSVRDVGVDSEAASKAAADSRWYSVTGVAFAGRPSQPGLYIHGGRKVIIR